MIDQLSINTAQNNDLVQLVGLSHKYFILRLKSGAEFQTHRGVLKHDDIIGKCWGSKIVSHKGSPFFLFRPSLADILRVIKRNTQILYPKDIGFILVTLGIGPGQKVIEAGTGSGALTSAFAYTVGSNGQVCTYEMREEMQTLAKRNIDNLGFSDRVVFNLHDISNGFLDTGADALFLDVPNPYDFIPQVRDALKAGGFFGSILPTFNQVTRLLSALRKNNFAFVEVCEVLLRYYKPEPERLRPVDRMVAHTGFLIFGRSVTADDTGELELELFPEANEEQFSDDES